MLNPFTKRSRYVLLILVSALVSALSGLTLPAWAQRPDAPAYAKRGPFTVGTREVKVPSSDRTLDATIWYPTANPDKAKEEVNYEYGVFQGTGRAILNAPPDSARGPYPLIVFSHGLSGFRYQSITYTEQLASYGFVVIAADHPGSTFFDVLGFNTSAILTSFGRRPLEVLDQIKFAESLTAKDGLMAGMIDTNRIGVTGHSFGGYTTLAAGGAQLDFRSLEAACKGDGPKDEGCGLLTGVNEIARARGLSSVPTGLWPATTDPRIRAIVALAPSSGPNFGKEGYAPLSVPMMIIVGSKDTATPPEINAFPAYAQVSSQTKALVVLENAGHYVFVEKCPQVAIALGRYGQCSDRVWDMDRAHDLINHHGVAFFLMTLKDDAAARKALTIGAAPILGVRYENTIK